MYRIMLFYESKMLQKSLTTTKKIIATNQALLREEETKGESI